MNNQPSYVQLSPNHQEVSARTGITFVPLSNGGVSDEKAYDLVERIARTILSTDEGITNGNPNEMFDPTGQQQNTSANPAPAQSTTVDPSAQARIAELEAANRALQAQHQQTAMVPSGYQNPAMVPQIPHLAAMTQLGQMPQVKQEKRFSDFIDLKLVMICLSFLTLGSVIFAFVSVTAPSRREDNYSEMLQEQSIVSMNAVQEASKRANVCISFNCANSGSASDRNTPTSVNSPAQTPVQNSSNASQRTIENWKKEYPDQTVRDMIVWQQNNNDPSLPPGDSLAQAYNSFR